jgi:hypothetical protein
VEKLTQNSHRERALNLRTAGVQAKGSRADGTLGEDSQQFGLTMSHRAFNQDNLPVSGTAISQQTVERRHVLIPLDQHHQLPPADVVRPAGAA